MRDRVISSPIVKVVLGLTIPLVLAARVGAGEQGKVMMEKVEYQGWPNNLRITNGTVELIVTLDVGPRILSYRLVDGKNVFKEYADQLGKSGEAGWMIRGGHRLWTSPEDLTRTYAPDNGPVAFEKLADDLVRLKPAADEFGIQKEIDIKLDAEGSGVMVAHRIRNVGREATELAPWALTVMAPGGVEIIPLPPKAPHPGSVKGAKSAEDFGPNVELILWPYFDFSDDRWSFGRKYITLHHKDRGPTKLGLNLSMGWAGYLNGSTLFVKRFPYEVGKTYPDRGASYETFTNEDMVEMESLGPLVRLAPGEATVHEESWRLVGGVGKLETEEEIDRVLMPERVGK